MKTLTALITAAMLCLGSGCGEGWFEAGEVRDPCTGKVVGELVDEDAVRLFDGQLVPLATFLDAQECEQVGSQQQAMTKAELIDKIYGGKGTTGLVEESKVIVDRETGRGY